MTREVAASAGEFWKALGSHVEAQAAAFMWKEETTEAVLYINASTPCLGRNGIGCLFLLPVLIPPAAKLTVFNKNGKAFPFEGRLY